MYIYIIKISPASPENTVGLFILELISAVFQRDIRDSDHTMILTT